LHDDRRLRDEQKSCDRKFSHISSFGAVAFRSFRGLSRMKRNRNDAFLSNCDGFFGPFVATDRPTRKNRLVVESVSEIFDVEADDFSGRILENSPILDRRTQTRRIENFPKGRTTSTFWTPLLQPFVRCRQKTALLRRSKSTGNAMFSGAYHRDLSKVSTDI